jgi:hypothetical protein
MLRLQPHRLHLSTNQGSPPDLCHKSPAFALEDMAALQDPAEGPESRICKSLRWMRNFHGKIASKQAAGRIGQLANFVNDAATLSATRVANQLRQQPPGCFRIVLSDRKSLLSQTPTRFQGPRRVSDLRTKGYGGDGEHMGKPSKIRVIKAFKC